MAKVLVSIDARLLARLDRAARRLRVTRSAYLSRLAARELGAERGPGSDPKVRQAIADLKQLFAANPTPGDATEIIRSMRDSR